MSKAHPAASDKAITMLRRDHRGHVGIEGHAFIEAPPPNTNRYRARFNGDPVTRERLINPRIQRDPERVLAVLVDVWRSVNDHEILWSDFWPDHA